jgi:energy-coupling factor transporter ATP-binding protein EcfA2
LRNVQLEISAGQFVLIAGPSGCGKSTLGLALAGLIPSRVPGEMEGGVYLDGQNLSEMELHEVSQHVGMVFQNTDTQLIQFKVDLEVAFGPENLNLPHAEISSRVDQALRYTGADKFRHALIETLSGGQKQRVAIAAALSMRPSILVLDEPTSDLDPQGTQDVLKVLRHLNKEIGMTVVLIEHKIDEVIHWTDRVLLMDQGQIVVDRHPHDAFQETQRWYNLGVSVPEMVQISYALPDIFSGQVALTVEEAVDALRGTPYARTLTSAPPIRKRRPISGNPLLQWNQVQLSYGEKQVLQGVNLEVHENEWVALAGSNGSGKTSLAALAMGFSGATAGEISCYGRPVKTGEIFRQAKMVGYLFQSVDYMLFSPSVKKELTFGRTYGRRQKSNTLASESALAQLIDLADRLDANPFQLSYGQRQRLAIAALLSSNPKALILDEPTTGQDEGHARALLEFLDMLRRTQDLTYLMITHDMRAAARYADRMVVLNTGRLVLDDHPERVFAQSDLLAACQVVPPPIARLHGLLTEKRASWVCLDVPEFLQMIGIVDAEKVRKEVFLRR